MPQEIRVLKCYKCFIFQTDIVKKVKKWQCKMCGEKQTVRQEFGRGSAKDCRLHVQKLNKLRMESDEIATAILENNFQDDGSVCSNKLREKSKKPIEEIVDLKLNKWESFVENIDEGSSNTDSIFTKFGNQTNENETENINTNYNKNRIYSKPFKTNFQNTEKNESGFVTANFNCNLAHESTEVPTYPLESSTGIDTFSTKQEQTHSKKRHFDNIVETCKKSKWDSLLPDN